MNILFSSGTTVQLAVGETYEVKDDEVYINYHPYKKRDLEIKMSNNHATADPEFVKVGIRLRDGQRTLPADKKKFTEWVIDDAFQTSLSELVENINNSLQ